jgi:hypothetical protein
VRGFWLVKIGECSVWVFYFIIALFWVPGKLILIPEWEVILNFYGGTAGQIVSIFS